VRGEAPAKVNLWLEVVGRRPDGWHELRTLFQTVDLHDDLEVTPTDGPGVSCATTGAALPDGPENLAVRAAQAYLDAAGLGGGARVSLTKRIPIGGGLGGGSSDAATVLRLLEARHRALGAARLTEVAKSVGADVPFLLRGGTAEGRGRGDEIHPLPDAPRTTLVLLAPPFSTETAAVFARWSGTPLPERGRAAPRGGFEACLAALRAGDAVSLREAHHNDLAFAAMRAQPALLRLASDVERCLGRPPCLTGSGSTLFDVPAPGELDEVLARLRGVQARVEVVHTTKAFGE
jgi:4-diphosphocytidyl-2-C-methyl-D-erythritol kinase